MWPRLGQGHAEAVEQWTEGALEMEQSPQGGGLSGLGQGIWWAGELAGARRPQEWRAGVPGSQGSGGGGVEGGILRAWRPLGRPVYVQARGWAPSSKSLGCYGVPLDRC